MRKTILARATFIRVSLFFCACVISNLSFAQGGVTDLSYLAQSRESGNDVWFNKCSEDAQANVKKCTEDGAKKCAGKIGNATQGSGGALCECMNNQLSYCLERFCKNQKPDNY